MSTFAPLEVSVAGKKLSCVLDVPLALSPHGLMFALRLSHELNVWLVRSLWQILDSRDFYPDLLLLAHRRSAGPRAVRQRDHQRLNEAIHQWEWARLDCDLAGLNVFWAGDARYESLLPRDVDKALVDRFDRLAAELDSRWSAPGEVSASASFDPRRECARDAVALAVALVRYRPLIFTLVGNGGGTDARSTEPALCEYLRECNITPHRVTASPYAAVMKRHLMPIFARSGIVELLWGGLDLAVVHLVAPGAVIVPVDPQPGEREGNAALAAEFDRGGRHYFEGSSAHWWTMD
jgi:hypothetical protein